MKKFAPSVTSSSSGSIDFTRRFDRNNAHEVPLSEMLAEFETDTTQGLTSHKAAERLRIEGPNKITPSKPNYFKKV